MFKTASGLHKDDALLKMMLLTCKGCMLSSTLPHSYPVRSVGLRRLRKTAICPSRNIRPEFGPFWKRETTTVLNRLFPEVDFPELYFQCQQVRTDRSVPRETHFLDVYFQWQQVWKDAEFLLMSSSILSMPETEENSRHCWSIYTERRTSHFGFLASQHYCHDIKHRIVPVGNLCTKQTILF